LIAVDQLEISGAGNDACLASPRQILLLVLKNRNQAIQHFLYELSRRTWLVVQPNPAISVGVCGRFHGFVSEMKSPGLNMSRYKYKQGVAVVLTAREAG
jgi:hypothetical protein